MRVLIALGSNLGDRAANLEAARTYLQTAGVRILARSAAIETAAVGGEPALPYLNAILEVDAPPDPFGLLALVKRIEVRMGRDARAPRMAPRVIDLDLLAAEGTTVSSASLSLPHPRLWRREFVLAPLQGLPGRDRFFGLDAASLADVFGLDPVLG